MIPSVLVLPAIILLVSLLYFEKQSRPIRLLSAKTALSALFVIVAAMLRNPDQTVDQIILIGLACCLVGDVLLAIPGDRSFLLGLVAFLVGHVWYVAAFVSLAAFSRWAPIGAAATSITSACIYVWLRPFLGRMHSAVVVYIIVITAMMGGAWAVLGTVAMPPLGRTLVFLGALLFYLSDLFVARDRFVQNRFINRLVGLPMYYTAQFMIAFSVSING